MSEVSTPASMRIAFFAQNVAYSTFSSVISGWSHALAASGVEDIDIVSIVGNPAEQLNSTFPPQARHVVLPCGRAARAVIPLRRYLHEAAPDVLIPAGLNINLIAIVAALTSRWHGKLILTHHHPIAMAHACSWKDNKYAAKLLYRFAHGSFAVSPDTLEDAVRECHLDRSTMACIPNVLPPATQIEDYGDVHPWLCSEPNGGPVFLTVSRLVPTKNFPLLLESFRMVADEIDACLLIIGKGEEEATIRRLVKDKHLGARVDLLGFVPSPRPYLKKADAFVLASNEEGFSQVLLEAMSEGLPVISTDSDGGGPRFVLQNGRYGLLVPKGDLESLAAAMVSMTDPSVRAKYSALGLQRATNFTPEVVGPALLDFLENVAMQH